MTDIAASRPAIRFHSVVFDTPDHQRLGQFYADLLDWKVTSTDDDWVTVTGDTGVIGCQLAPDHVAPTWPDNAVPQQIHLDVTVDDMEAAHRYVLSIGATKVPGDVDGDGFRVFLDPAGHPFCLCR